MKARSNAIFLSASVPDARRSPDYAETADVVAIQEAVKALVYLIVGRRPLVWGGHPAITPMIMMVAEDLNVDYNQWVTLYQSRFFEGQFPEANRQFSNIIYTDDVESNREKSLLEMRTRMFRDHSFSGSVFIGGMQGIFDEWELFREFQAGAIQVPVASTGGASLELAEQYAPDDKNLFQRLDYLDFFSEKLGISHRERRYRTPGEQSEDMSDRYDRYDRFEGRE